MALYMSDSNIVFIEACRAEPAVSPGKTSSLDTRHLVAAGEPGFLGFYAICQCAKLVLTLHTLL